MVFQDEASLSNTATVSYSWAEKGKQPRINQKQRKRERKTLFGCIEPETGIVITDKADKGNTASFFSFLLLVVKKYHDRKVVMVLDNVPYHHAKRLKPVLERYKHRIELAYLPPYSPDLNPIERVWWYMRKKITHNRYVQNLQDRINNFDTFMNDFRVENEIGKALAKLIVNI
ncbi:IS630 family transposase [Mucilaginibacter arboris]|uniref:IS630 family transposase n=1 Tax=Mucilaginibacter arboris TaxID=2682090 RepID=A0A7K1SXH9_9SPHI|nr:IS630 family transposase [Mucilaginibacter arboris]MVN22024.1 IS630 family transposase [Mucilaginibacter arboris]